MFWVRVCSEFAYVLTLSMFWFCLCFNSVHVLIVKYSRVNQKTVLSLIRQQFISIRSLKRLNTKLIWCLTMKRIISSVLWSTYETYYDWVWYCALLHLRTYRTSSRVSVIWRNSKTQSARNYKSTITVREESFSVLNNMNNDVVWRCIVLYHISCWDWLFFSEICILNFWR